MAGNYKRMIIFKYLTDWQSLFWILTICHIELTRIRVPCRDIFSMCLYTSDSEAINLILYSIWHRCGLRSYICFSDKPCTLLGNGPLRGKVMRQLGR